MFDQKIGTRLPNVYVESVDIYEEPNQKYTILINTYILDSLEKPVISSLDTNIFNNIFIKCNYFIERQGKTQNIPIKEYFENSYQTKDNEYKKYYFKIKFTNVPKQEIFFNFSSVFPSLLNINDLADPENILTSYKTENISVNLRGVIENRYLHICKKTIYKFNQNKYDDEYIILSNNFYTLDVLKIDKNSSLSPYLLNKDSENINFNFYKEIKINKKVFPSINNKYFSEVLLYKEYDKQNLYTSSIVFFNKKYFIYSIQIYKYNKNSKFNFSFSYNGENNTVYDTNQEIIYESGDTIGIKLTPFDYKGKKILLDGSYSLNCNINIIKDISLIEKDLDIIKTIVDNLKNDKENQNLFQVTKDILENYNYEFKQEDELVFQHLIDKKIKDILKNFYNSLIILINQEKNINNSDAYVDRIILNKTFLRNNYLLGDSFIASIDKKGLIDVDVINSKLLISKIPSYKFEKYDDFTNSQAKNDYVEFIKNLSSTYVNEYRKIISNYVSLNNYDLNKRKQFSNNEKSILASTLVTNNKIIKYLNIDENLNISYLDNKGNTNIITFDQQLNISYNFGNFQYKEINLFSEIVNKFIIG